MALGSRIRFYRQKLHWTLEQLSELSGVEVGTISALEKRDSKRSEFGGRIAKAFGMTLDELLDESRDHMDANRRHLLLTAREPEVNYAVGPRWPFDNIDARKIQSLPRDDLLRLEGALLSVAASLGVDIRKQAVA